ncbi:MAG: glycosyltransferase [Gemmatimonadetes bacterium]|nr:glycosyltransferase [Gemmatimonadota bacterium]
MTSRVSVLVPSYRRPESLARCLAALAAQERVPDEVVVGVRAGDTETVKAAHTAGDGGLNVRTAIATEDGVIAAMQAALDAATGDVIALTDDDARPRRAWISGLLAHLESASNVGGAGGRDWQPYERGDVARVGIVQWFGRVIGNHHLGAGAARDVDVLKGVNCAFRAPLLRAVGFDHRLRGTGAQLHWELGVCLPLRRAGWRLIYDPSVAVDHDVAPRHAGDALHRGVFAVAPLVDAVHNETVAVIEGRGRAWRAGYLAWALLVGTGEAPGAAQCARLLLRGDSLVWHRWRSAVAGRRLGAATARHRPRAPTVPCPPT